ncbi:MAG: hypothetical protein LWW75_10335, partial [Chlorobiales bacterium]|nr:hypothetical protein [Chlorobiales bacterium]
MLFHEVSSGGSEAANEVVKLVRQEAPVLEHLHFFVEAGGAASLRKDSDMQSQAGFRALNNDYSSKDQGDPAYAAFALKIFGKTLQVDRAYERRGAVRGGADAVASEMGRQRRAFARNLGRNLNQYLIAGDHSVSALQFNGLRKTVAGMAAAQTLDILGANGLQVITGIDNSAKKAQQAFVEALNVLITSVAGGAQCLMMNPKVI